MIMINLYIIFILLIYPAISVHNKPILQNTQIIKSINQILNDPNFPLPPPQPTPTLSPSLPTTINPYLACPNLRSTTICSNFTNEADKFCKPLQNRIFDSENCCFSCMPCSATHVSNCQPLNVLKTCQYNELPYKEGAPCCQTCIPPIQNVCSGSQRDTISICDRGIVPSLNSTGCPTCLSVDGRLGSCAKEKKDVCEALLPFLPFCPGGQQPTRNPDTCCLSCKLPLVEPNACRSIDIDNCVKNMLPNTRMCQSNEIRVFNVSNCCLTCNIPLNPFLSYTPAPPTSRNDKSSAATRCSRSEVAKCIASMPICAFNDMPINIPSQCCPSCSRPETLCSPDFVVKCIETTRFCSANESPSYVAGECCPTCIKKYQSQPCNLVCNSAQVCSIIYSEGTYTPVCSPISKLQISISSSNLNKQSQLLQYGNSTMRSFINELISRYCTGLVSY